jgi:hypothetical protein
MADFFGAQGIIAARELQNANLLTGLNAQKMLGDIAMQPLEMQDKQALVRTHQAQADEAASAVESARQTRQLQMRFLESQQEDAARRQMSEAAAGQGKIATVGDLPVGGSIVKASQADELERYLEFTKGALPLDQQAKLRGEIAGIKQKEAAAASSQASAGLNEHKQRVQQFELIGNIAGAAGASEANYRAIMMSPQRQLLPRELTGNWRTDAPVLRAIEMASQDSIKRANLAREQQDSESKRRLDEARRAEAVARGDNLKVQGKTLKRDYEQQTKTGGEYSPEALALKKAQTENLISQRQARDAETYPLLPLTEKGVDIGQVYTAANGKLVRVVGLREDGKPRLEAYDNPADFGSADTEGDLNDE